MGKKKFPYNKPKVVDGIVCTKYREDTPPEEMKRIRAIAHRKAQAISYVWVWRGRQKVQVNL